MKKAFTLSEALVTLAILGVLAAILIPVVSNVRPDKDKVTYKKALYTMQNAVSNAMDSTTYTMAANSAAYWKDVNVEEEDFCRAIADSLNIAGKVNCSSSGYNCPDGNPNKSCYESPNFITTDGIRYWGLEGKVFYDDPDGNNDVNERIIYVDRKLTPGEINAIARNRNSDSAKPGLKIKVRYDGRISTDESDTYENELIENSLQVQHKEGY